jgi:hypothetical protein
MTKKHQSLFIVAAFTMSALALSAIGCGSDPDGNTGNGGKGGSGAGGGGGTSTGTLGAIKGMALETFDTSAGMFAINNYVDASGSNLGAMGAATAAATTAVWDAAEGSPSPGALKVTAPFTDWNQYVDVHAGSFMAGMLPSWTGKKFHVRMKVASGFVTDTSLMGGAQPYVLTGSGYVFGSAWTNVPSGDAWHDFSVDLSTITTAGFDPTMVMIYGLQIASGQGNTTAAKPTTATFYVDSFSIE